jgi:hypothetical protein
MSFQQVNAPLPVVVEAHGEGLTNEVNGQHTIFSKSWSSGRGTPFQTNATPRLPGCSRVQSAEGDRPGAAGLAWPTRLDMGRTETDSADGGGRNEMICDDRGLPKEGDNLGRWWWW